MKVLILGAGRVGCGIARYLAYEDDIDYDVTIVDNYSKNLEMIAEKLDIQPILGHASDPEVLKKAGLEGADLLIAVTSVDEVNIVACEIANALYHVPMKIARVRNNNYMKSKWASLFHHNHVAVDRLISPEAEVAKILKQNTEVVGAFHVFSLCDGKIKVIGVRVQGDAPLLNTQLRMLPAVLPKVNMALLTILREGETIFPQERDVIQEGDEVFFATTNEDVNLCMESFGYYDHTQRNILIVGGGNIGLKLAQELEKVQNVSIHLIEKDIERCEYLAQQLERTEIFQGDALEADLLNNLNIYNCEGVISVTNDDKVNILSGLLMKRQGALHSSVLLNSDEYGPLVSSLGIDTIVNPRSITVSSILQSIRRGGIETVYSLHDDHTEIIEAKAPETSNIIGLTVEDACIANEMMVVALVRDHHINFNPMRMIVSINDVLLIITRKEAVKKIEQLFSVRSRYF